MRVRQLKIEINKNYNNFGSNKLFTIKLIKEFLNNRKEEKKMRLVEVKDLVDTN